MAGEVSRRQLVAGLAALGAAGLAAGCRRAGDEPAAMRTTPSPSPERSPERSLEPAVTETSATSPEPMASHASAPPAAAPALVVPVLCRDAWGAGAPSPTDASHEPVRITLHHTAVVLDDNREAPERLRGHQRYHRDSGFSDIAYHVGVDRNGNVYELRDPAVPGETFTNYDPAGHFLVLAEGEFGSQVPTDEQLEGLAHVIAGASRRHGIPVDTLTGHRDHDAATACPGDNLYARLVELRSRATQILDQEPELSLWCDDTAFERVAAIERGDA